LNNIRKLTLGIIGGMGPSATVDLMDKIIKNTPAKKDQGHIKMIVDHNPQIPDRTAYLLQNGEDPTIPLLTCARNLEQWGADFIAIPCSTAHAFVDEIQQNISIPVIHMIKEVLLYMQRNYPQTKTAGLLATTGTVEIGVYHHAFEKAGKKLIHPNEKHQRFVMEAIYGKNGVKAGFTKGKPREALLKAAKELVKQGAQVLILGCTELPLILEENDAFKVDRKSVVVLDPTNILAKKCVNMILDLDHNNSKIVRK